MNAVEQEAARLIDRLGDLEKVYAGVRWERDEALKRLVELRRALRDAIANIDPASVRDYAYWQRLAQGP